MIIIIMDYPKNSLKLKIFGEKIILQPLSKNYIEDIIFVKILINQIETQIQHQIYQQILKIIKIQILIQ